MQQQLKERYNIYHVFNAQQAHLALEFIPQFQEMGRQYNIPTYFILCNYAAGHAEHYQQLISKIGPEQFEFVENGWMTVAVKFGKLLKGRQNKFIVHGVVLKLWFLLPTLLSPFMRRFSWVCWGSGLETGHHLQQMMKRRLYSSFAGVNCLMLGDKNDLESRFRNKGRTYLIPYFSDYDMCDSDSIVPYLNTDKVNVLVGHRASPFLNHIALFEMLSRYAGHHFRVVCFLNYGSDDRRYIETVQEKGRQLFKENFVPITQMLTKDEYEGVMKSIHITLIAGARQAGLGAVYRTVLHKGTVFLDAAGKNHEWLDHINIKTARIEDIPGYDFNRFTTAVSSEERQQNRETLLSFINRDRLWKQWNDFLTN